MNPIKSIAALAMAAFCAVTIGCAASPGAASKSDAANVANGAPAWQLKTDMRKLWTDHVVWTRDYIIAAAADAPDLQMAANRLMKNQEDIGSAIAGYYGKAAGDELTTLLKAHISTAADVIKAAKSGDKTAFKTADDAWQQNARAVPAIAHAC